MAEIVMYTSDRCPYCIRAKRLLDTKGVEYQQVHLALEDIDARRDLQRLTGRFTVPQVVVDGMPVGGWEDIAALERAGRLDDLLEAA